MEFEAINEPIPILFDGVTFDILYYGNSPSYRPTQIFSHSSDSYYNSFLLRSSISIYLTSKASSQNLLWAGMAKETAHQIGTPLSSFSRLDRNS